MRFIVTGGCGFIGSNFVDFLRDNGHRDVKIVDKMTYAANVSFAESVKDILLVGDIADPEFIGSVFKDFKPDIVVNFSAETHVDRSIVSASEFVMSNIVGVQVLLDAVRKYPCKFIQIGTDECYGDLGFDAPASKETDKIFPSSPYSASKAAADLLVLAYVRTHGVNACITRCSNNFGERQNPEKLIPLVIGNIKTGKKIPVYGNGTNIRDWIYVKDHCRGVLEVCMRGKSGEIYNFGGANQVRNIDLIRKIWYMCHPEWETPFSLISPSFEDIIEFVKDRKGHDTRYDIDFSKAEREFGWTPKFGLEDGLDRTLRWYGAIE